MKKSMRVLAAIMAMGMCIAFLPACSSGTSNATQAAAPSGTTAAQAAQTEAAEKKADEVVTIEYWQYVYESKINLMDQLITEFEAQNPNIKVVHKSFPYADYEQKLAAELAASAGTGNGPNIINIFYGWVPKYVKSGVLSELPQEISDDIDKNFSSVVQINKIEGKYYTIPIAVRTSALFYNKTLLEAAGLKEEDIPTDLIKFAELASSLAVWNGDTLELAGCTWQPSGQYHSWLRPVLMNQFGGKPISDDGKTANWNSKECLDAFRFFISLTTDYKVGVNNFYTDDVTAFSSGKSYFHVDGSYRLGTLKSTVSDFEWGVTELPSYNGVKGSFGSFWTNGITATTLADPAKYEASLKFIKFITSEEVMKRWTNEVGEIGARQSISKDETLLADLTMAPFIKALDYASSYFYVDEASDRQIIMDAIDEVVLNNKDPEDAINEANERVQALLDEYWKE